MDGWGAGGGANTRGGWRGRGTRARAGLARAQRPPLIPRPPRCARQAFTVSSLSKGKFQDNNEFMQWFKVCTAGWVALAPAASVAPRAASPPTRPLISPSAPQGYWDHVTGGAEVVEEYDPLGRRQVCKSGDWKKVRVGAAPGGGHAHACLAACARAASRGASPSHIPALELPPSQFSLGETGARPSAPGSIPAEQAQAQVDALTEQLTELKLKVEGVERERDFYFDKLRDIEILCQAPELQEMPGGWVGQ